ncbi:MAG: carbonic anhydrase [Candidatus Nanopelagicales bacterium]
MSTAAHSPIASAETGGQGDSDSVGEGLARENSARSDLAREGSPSDDVVPFPLERFADILEANAGYAASFADLGLSPKAARGLAVITCMDSRIDPLRILGMKPGDVKILRNAGGRVTNDVLRTLVLAAYLLDVRRVLVMPHTRCRMVGSREEDIHALIAREHGVDTRGMEFRTVQDQVRSLRTDVRRIRSFPLLPADIVVGGAVYDVDTGLLDPVDA